MGESTLETLTYNQALSFAIKGEALFILGSGFSSHAKNLSNESVFDGNTLKAFLCEKIGLDQINFDLKTAAQRYLKIHGDNDFKELFKKIFTVASYDDCYKSLLRIKNFIAYSTNYDDLIERIFEDAYSKKNQQVIGVTVGTEINDVRIKNRILHMNGFVRSEKDSFDNTYVLTNRSYINGGIFNSHWLPYMKEEIRNASAIFIVGLSLSGDLDVERIISSDSEIREKCFIISKPNLTIGESEAFNEYGKVIDIGVDCFLNDLKEIPEPIIDNSFEEKKFTCFTKHSSKIAKKSINDKQVFELFFQGNLRDECFFKNECGNFVSLVNRSKLTQAINDIDNGKSLIIHSDLGNGKTAFISMLRRMINDVRFFSINKTLNNKKLLSEIRCLCENNEKKIIIIESYNNFIEEIKLFAQQICQSKTSSVQFVFSARTAMHDNNLDVLFDNTNKMRIELGKTINLNELYDEELEEITALFDKYGLWGDLASRSKEYKIKTLKGSGRNECKSRFQNILLKIFESKDIKERFSKQLDLISNDNNLLHILMLSLMNDIIQLEFTRDDFSVIFDDVDIERIIKQHKHSVNDLFDVSYGGVLKIKSAIIAKAILNISKIINSENLLSCLADVCKKLDAIYSPNTKYEQALKNLANASYLSFVFDYNSGYKDLLVYFEQIKALKYNQKNLFFWLQYAIICCNMKEYDRAEIYFATSYSFANSKQRFSNYQIDTHYARFLLEKQLYGMDYSNCFDSFSEAHDLLLHKFYKNEVENRKHYIFHVAEKYGEYYKMFFNRFNGEQKNKFIECCIEMRERTEGHLSSNLEVNLPRYVENCRDVLNEILNREKDNFNIIK